MTTFRSRKLSAAQRLEIVDHIRQGYTHQHLASIYGVSRSRIGQIANATDEQLAEWERVAALPDLESQNDSN